MPLLKSDSKKAFSKNVETEMNAGKPQKQSLAISYAVQKKNKRKNKMAMGGTADDSDDFAKKQSSGAQTIAQTGQSDAGQAFMKGFKQAKANGGMIESNAKYEKRPMPDEAHNDSDQERRNKGNKASKQDSWTDNSTIGDAQKISVTKMSQPKMVGSDAFSVRNRDLHDDQDDLMDRVPPETDRAQPPKRDDEQNAGGYGKDVSDNERQHNNGKAAYEKASEHDDTEDQASPEMKKVQSPPGRYADGGRVQLEPRITADSLSPEEVAMIHEHRMANGGPVMEPKDHDMELMERDDEGDMEDRLAPGKHGEQPKSSLDEEDADGSGNPVSDNERQHSDGKPAYAKGGMANNPKLQQSHVDLEEEHPEDVASAIMMKKKKKMMADGGSIHSKDSIYSDDSSQADVSRNADEDANMEDQSSYDSLRKENYNDSEGLNEIDRASKMDSGQHGDDIEADIHDMVSKIRSKIRSRI